MFDRLKKRLVEGLDLPRIAARADGAADAVDHLDTAIRRIDRSDAELAAEVAALGTALRNEVAELRRWTTIAQATEWAAAAPLRARPLVSVVMPTRNRAERLAGAIASIDAQTYDHWQLVVVDDGSADDTPALLAARAADEPRLRVETTAGVGAAAARNVGLRAASGDWVAFLDDDNVMHPGWLRAIAEYVGRSPDCRALFGAQLRDDVADGRPTPWLLFDEHPELDRLRHDNSIDLGVLAVRAGHPQLRFDESLTLYIDWEMIVRIMEATSIRPLPVLASTYTCGAAERISDQHGEQTLAAMRRRLAR